MAEVATFTARLDSGCAAACGEPISQGDEVKWAEEEFGQPVIIHVACQMPEEVAAPGTVCTMCWTVRSVSGACSCDA